MTNAEFEPTPSEITPVHRFYSDLHHYSESYVDLAIAAEKLLVQSRVMAPSDPTDWLYGEVIPTSEVYEQDPRRAIEQLSLMPLRLVGPYVDQNWGYDEKHEWYDQTIGFVKKFNEDNHGWGCHAGTQDREGMSCSESRECPLVFSKTFLQHKAMATDFNQPEYIVDPVRTCEDALLKLDLADYHGFISGVEADAVSKLYVSRFEAEFGRVAGIARPEQES